MVLYWVYTEAYIDTYMYIYIAIFYICTYKYLLPFFSHTALFVREDKHAINKELGIYTHKYDLD